MIFFHESRGPGVIPLIIFVSSFKFQVTLKKTNMIQLCLRHRWFSFVRNNVVLAMSETLQISYENFLRNDLCLRHCWYRISGCLRQVECSISAVRPYQNCLTYDVIRGDSDNADAESVVSETPLMQKKCENFLKNQLFLGRRWRCGGANSADSSHVTVKTSSLLKGHCSKESKQYEHRNPWTIERKKNFTHFGF
jgi:hypothetical protein